MAVSGSKKMTGAEMALLTKWLLRRNPTELANLSAQQIADTAADELKPTVSLVSVNRVREQLDALALPYRTGPFRGSNGRAKATQAIENDLIDLARAVQKLTDVVDGICPSSDDNQLLDTIEFCRTQSGAIASREKRLFTDDD